MFQLIHEAGIGAWFVILFIIAGLAAVTTVGRRWGRPGSIAAVWAVVILAAGANGFAAGQRMVDRGINRPNHPAHPDRPNPPDPGMRIALLSRGSAEAAANLTLAANGALLVMLVGGAMVFFRKKDAPSGPAPSAPART